ncbi:MAG TPA: M50 family metallopeptidase [Candidatus Saccharimonadales bacterium]|nr:M50 family metallopeptidase [Candidatus Saccharimonadales bacterium]
MLITALVFLLLLSVLVLIHEAGHFFVAKRFGIKVEEFGFGLPLTKALFSKKIGETIYSFYPALIGGFVKLYGEDDAGAGRVKLKVKSEKLKVGDEDRAFYSRSLWQRAAVILAGVVMNTILAIVIFYAFLAVSNFQTVVPILGENAPQFIGAEQKFIPKGASIGRVAPGSPAEKAGIKIQSVVTSINGQKVTGNNELIDIINKNKGKETTVDWFDINANKKFTANIVPRVSPPKNEGAVGIAFDYNQYDLAILNYEKPENKIFAGFSHTYNTFLYNADGIRALFSQSVKEKNVGAISKNVGGPVMIFKIVGDIIKIPDAKEIVLQLLNMAGTLSLSLAFFNVLPIPGLDGGRLFFIEIEAVTRRKLNPKFESIANAVGMAVLIGLIMLITFKDIFLK